LQYNTTEVHNTWSAGCCRKPGIQPAGPCHKCVYFGTQLITFRMSRRRREMYIGHVHLSFCVSVRGRMPTLLHGPGYNLGGMVGGAP